MSTITVTTFKWVPPIVQGLVRDLRVRWALEEAGLAYTTHLIGPTDQQSAKFLIFIGPFLEFYLFPTQLEAHPHRAARSVTMPDSGH